MSRPRQLLAFSLFLALAAQTSAETLEGNVVGVRDGDDVVLLVDKTQHRIRLAGIDAPELGQSFGRRAKQALSDLVFGKTALQLTVSTVIYTPFSPRSCCARIYI